MALENALRQEGVWGLPFSWGEDGVFFPDDSISVEAQGAIRKIVLENFPLPSEKTWASIMLERDRRMEMGGYLVGEKWFHSDQKSRSQQLGLVLLGDNIPEGLWWKTMDGTFVTMTPELARQILAAAAANDVAIFNVAEAHRASMEGSADPANYDFSTGWPSMFGE